jgi:hypothetical protein
MTMTEHADVLDTTAEDVVLSMWEATDLSEGPPADPTAPAVWATVPLEGTLPLLVAVACSVDLADRVAGHLFGGGDPSAVTLTDADRLDAVGELANLVAGRVKTELCPGGTTGLPTPDSGPSAAGPDGPGTDYQVDGAWMRLSLEVRSD